MSFHLLGSSGFSTTSGLVEVILLNMCISIDIHRRPHVQFEANVCGFYCARRIVEVRGVVGPSE